LPGPGVPRPHPACHRPPAPDGEVGAARGDVVEEDEQLVGVEGAVAVHDGDVVGGGGLDPGVDRGAVARARLGDDTGAQPRATSAVPSREPLSTTITEKLARDPRQQGREGGCLVAAGQDEVGRRARGDR
jgi:hypothetical protein